MGATTYLLPWILLLLTTAIAFAVKFLPFKSIAGASVVGTLALTMIGIAIFDNILSSEYEERIEQAKAETAKLEEWKYQHLDDLSLTIAQFIPPAEEDLYIVQQLIGYGWTHKNAYHKRILEAARLLQELRNNRPDAARPIYLYKGIPASVNKSVVSLGLKTLGFKVIPPRESEEPLIQANILYYGKYVDIQDVKLAALTLMQAGINLTEIKPFIKETRGNLRAVKLEYNQYMAKRPPILPQEVVDATDFK